MEDLDDFQVDAFNVEGELRVNAFDSLGITTPEVRRAADDLNKALNTYDMFTRPQEKINILSIYVKWDGFTKANMNMLALAIYVTRRYNADNPSSFLNDSEIISFLQEIFNIGPDDNISNYKASLLRYIYIVQSQ